MHGPNEEFVMMGPGFASGIGTMILVYVLVAFVGGIIIGGLGYFLFTLLV